MNISQFFVSKRPIAWTAMISVLVWGVYAYIDDAAAAGPDHPGRHRRHPHALPGAEAEKVEQEVTRKIERKVAENPAVEHVKSISRPGMSIVYVELFETERNAELVWQDIRGKLGEITDLPAGGRPADAVVPEQGLRRLGGGHADDQLAAGHRPGDRAAREEHPRSDRGAPAADAGHVAGRALDRRARLSEHGLALPRPAHGPHAGPASDGVRHRARRGDRRSAQRRDARRHAQPRQDPRRPAEGDRPLGARDRRGRRVPARRLAAVLDPGPRAAWRASCAATRGTSTPTASSRTSPTASATV